VADDNTHLAAQRRLLESLGFGFLEEAFDPSRATSSNAEPPAPSAPAPRPAATRRPASPRAAAPEPPPSAPPPQPPQPRAMPSAPPAERARELAEFHQRLLQCAGCNLQLRRHHVLPGIGNVGARLMLVADIPFAEDDAAGTSLNGPIGELVRKMTAAMKLREDEVFFTTSVKCRPVGGKAQSPLERRSCNPNLMTQVRLVQPEAIVTFGIDPLAQFHPNRAGDPLDAVRGAWLDAKGIALMPTLALADIVDDTDRKRVVWGDLKLVMKRLGLGS